MSPGTQHAAAKQAKPILELWYAKYVGKTVCLAYAAGKGTLWQKPPVRRNTALQRTSGSRITTDIEFGTASAAVKVAHAGESPDPVPEASTHVHSRAAGGQRPRAPLDQFGWAVDRSVDRLEKCTLLSHNKALCLRPLKVSPRLVVLL